MSVFVSVKGHIYQKVCMLITVFAEMKKSELKQR